MENPPLLVWVCRSEKGHCFDTSFERVAKWACVHQVDEIEQYNLVTQWAQLYEYLGGIRLDSPRRTAARRQRNALLRKHNVSLMDPVLLQSDAAKSKVR